MWVTRDKNGALRLWSPKPERKGDCWLFPFMSDFSFKLDSHLFPNLKWEDEPIEINLLSNEQIDEIVSYALKQTGIPKDKQAEIFAHLVLHNYFLENE